MKTKRPEMIGIIERITNPGDITPTSEGGIPTPATPEQRRQPMSTHMASLANAFKHPR